LLDPAAEIADPGLDVIAPLLAAQATSSIPPEDDLPGGAWKKRLGNFHYPYAAGIPGEVRFIYVPYWCSMRQSRSPGFQFIVNAQPTVFERRYD
jgi:hypothetical protein